MILARQVLVIVVGLDTLPTGGVSLEIVVVADLSEHLPLLSGAECQERDLPFGF